MLLLMLMNTRNVFWSSWHSYYCALFWLGWAVSGPSAGSFRHCCSGSLITRQLASWWYSILRLGAPQVWCSWGGSSASHPAMNCWKRRCRSASSCLTSPEVTACFCQGWSSVHPAGNPLLEVEITPGFSDRETVPLQNTVCATCLPKCKTQGFQFTLQVISIVAKKYVCIQHCSLLFFCVRCI